MITEKQLFDIMPRANTEVWLPVLNNVMSKFGINTPSRESAFLAQIAHESFELNRLVENLSYTAERVSIVWPKRFPTIESATPYARNPEKLANRVYSNRLGNGDVESGDGWLYRGRGIFQLTGRGNYRAASKALGFDFELNPKLVEYPEYAGLTAGWYWQSNGLNELADDGNNENDDSDFTKISIKINGGFIGLESRRSYYRRARSVLCCIQSVF
ncbi:putative chitinase [Gammaproteobacteria bacterium]